MPVIIPDIPDESCRSTPNCWMDEDDCASRQNAPPQQIYMKDAVDFTLSSQSIELAIRRDRERDGRCGDCGAQTHEFKFDPLAGTYMKIALTVNGEVHRGRCLLCQPISPMEDHRQIGAAGAAGAAEQLHNHNQMEAASNNHRIPLASANGAARQAPCSPSTMRRRVSGLTASVLGLYDPCDQSVRNALYSLIDGSNDIVDILFAMKRVPHDPIIQERGCERLWILSWEDDNAISIGRVGGITVIMAAMARFPRNSYLQQCACEAMQNLIALDEYNRREIAEQGGIDLIVGAMMNHVTVAGIQQSGCTALASMAASKEFNTDICRAGGVHALLLAARQYADEEGVLRCVKDACQAMGFDPKGSVPVPMEATS